MALREDPIGKVHTGRDDDVLRAKIKHFHVAINRRPAQRLARKHDLVGATLAGFVPGAQLWSRQGAFDGADIVAAARRVGCSINRVRPGVLSFPRLQTSSPVIGLCQRRCHPIGIRRRKEGEACAPICIRACPHGKIQRATTLNIGETNPRRAGWLAVHLQALDVGRGVACPAADNSDIPICQVDDGLRKERTV